MFGEREYLRNLQVPLWPRYWYNTPHPESHIDCCCSGAVRDSMLNSTQIYRDNYQTWGSDSYRSYYAGSSSSVLSESDTYMPQLYTRPMSPILFDYIVENDIGNFSESPTPPTENMASYLEPNLASYSVIDDPDYLTANRGSYPTQQSAAYPYNLGPIGYNWHGHDLQYINPYTMPSTMDYHNINGVLRVPAIYACQFQNEGSSMGCPLFCKYERDSTSCLYVSDINGLPLYFHYNELVTFFKRFPGFGDLHIVSGFIGFVVRYRTDCHTTLVKVSLDGFWMTNIHRLVVRYVDPTIYLYMHNRDFRPEPFFKNA